MDKNYKNSSFKPKVLVKLLNIGSETDKTKPNLTLEQQKGELLRFHLREILPYNSPLFDDPSDIFVHLCREASGSNGETTESLLFNSNTTLTIIQRIKNYYKYLVTTAESEMEHDVTAVIYYAAIASAFVNHESKITKFSYSDLIQTFSQYLKEEWIPPRLVELFRKACQHCQSKD